MPCACCQETRQVSVQPCRTSTTVAGSSQTSSLGGGPSYEVFARFYDAAMGTRESQAAFIKRLVQPVAPQARSLLELACGTGALLVALAPAFPDFYGLDLSEQMVAEAKQRLDSSRVQVADMRAFQLDRHFDVVLCAYDSINHLLTLDEWGEVFKRSSGHLRPNGVFVFDVNTRLQLEAFAAMGPVARWLEPDVLLVLDVQEANESFEWHVDVFARHASTNMFDRHSERIHEVAFPTSDIRALARRYFRRVDVFDRSGGKPSRWSKRLFYRCSEPIRKE